MGERERNNSVLCMVSSFMYSILEMIGMSAWVY